jgi:hypothetical protein
MAPSLVATRHLHGVTPDLVAGNGVIGAEVLSVSKRRAANPLRRAFEIWADRSPDAAEAQHSGVTIQDQGTS